MRNSSLGTLLGGALKMLLVAIFKLLFIAIAWGLKIAGSVLTTMGTTIEGILLKKS